MSDIIIQDCQGHAFDAPSARFTCHEDEDGLVGVEITDLEGMFQNYMVGVFCICMGEGTKVFLDAEQARNLAKKIILAADQLDAGATLFGGN